MADEEITVGTVSEGPNAGDQVRLPVVDLLTGRGFVTGKSGAGKSNSVSVIAEKLLDRGYALLVVDIDGEYYGLKEQYELLHVGADEECDIRVGPEHAEKIATLALENNVPIILDVSSYLDESEAAELLKAIARQLFTKEKKLKKPFLLLIEEIHEYIPEGGGLDECGRMLIKIGKRGRKHGLGIIGVSQRPADVKKDFITQCDWRCWHRLTWNNDTQVVRRVLSGTYAEAVESLADGEAFLRADWSSGVCRVQFDRKKTFDAGATPGLEEFERPDLKPVDTDLVSELQEISEEERHREAEIERLEAELAEKESRIEALERDLEEARDLRRMADEFASALFDHPGHSRAQIDAVDRLQETAAVNTDETVIAPTTEHNGDSIDPLEARPNVEPTGESSRDESQESQSEPAEDDREAQSASSSRPQADDSAERSSVSNQKSEASGDSETDADDGACVETDLERLPSVIQHVRREIESLDPTARAMLATYYTSGPLSPVAAHTRASGDGDRMDAYRHNSSLRRAEFITHVGRGQYEYAIPDRITDTSAQRSSDCLAALARVERELLSEADGRQ